MNNSIKGWSAVDSHSNSVSFSSLKVFNGDEYTADLICGDAGAMVVISKQGSFEPDGGFDLFSDATLFASWDDLKAHGTTPGRDDGKLNDGLKVAIRELVGLEIASDLGCCR